MRENAKSLTLEIKLINKSKLKTKASNLLKIEKKLAQVQKRLKVETESNQELNMWGLHSYLISYVLKCRVLEDLIDCAQRCKLRPDAQV